MATEKLRAELELITSTAEKDLARFHRSLKSVEKTVTSIGGKGGKSMRPLGEGLSAATANASEFEKSMAAANARVIAFGASAGLIIQVQRALKETVKSTIEVEKALTDINIVLNANAAGLQKFGDQLFKIAGQTGQSFKTIATGATELTRQGLGTEKTLGRLNDAMILSRLTGMGAEEAVSNLTAAVNSFSKAGITSAQVINKMAKVDQAFAVSSDDLAKAISRVGSSAVDAGVSMDELLAITTAVQQRTARGGAVIGNAFKTIFTRIGRTDVQKKLNAIGVETRDMQGHMLGATKVLQNLADKFGTLGQMQQNQLAESVAGVFQVNILRAALGDLSSEYGINARAIKISAAATDEAYKKNEQLNETLDALANKTLVNLTKVGAGVGEATLKPAIENVLNLVNSAIGAFGEGGRFEEFGKGIGKDLLTGLGNFLSGPGLAIITIGIGKLAINFASFAKTAIAGVLELNKNALARKGIEDSVTAALMKQPSIIKQIERGELSAATAAKDMLATMRAQNMEASKLAVTSRAIAGNMMGMGRGARGGRGGGRPGMASGLVPNFADADTERASAAAGGYKAGVIKTMNVPGEGNVMYNGAETVKRFPGMTQPAIMPPKESPAGANYKSAFGAAHGFDPYAADGFVPNFLSPSEIGSRIAHGRMTRQQAIDKHGYTGTAGLNLTQHQKNEYNKKGAKDSVKDFLDVKGQLGVVSLYGASQGVATNRTATMSVGQLGVFKEHVAKHPEIAKERIRFGNIQVSTLKGLEKNLMKEKKPSFSSLINKHLISPLANIGAELVGTSLGNQADPIGAIKQKMEGKNLLPKQSEGELFETAIKLALHSPKRFMQSMGDSPTAPFDFEEGTSPTKTFKKRLGFQPSLIRADAKRTSDSAAVNSLVKKAYNQHILIKEGLAKGPLLGAMGGGAFGKSPMVLPMAGDIRQEQAFGRLKGTARRPGGAHGFVPNFSPLGDAITRERAAGVPVSAIRVSSSPALRGPGNPGGLGVHNTIDEPAGLGQGISRSRRMGINPKAQGASGGFVPNFPAFDAIPAPAKRASYSIPIMDKGFFAEYDKIKDRKEAAERSKRDSKSSTTMKEASTRMAGAADKLQAGMGSFMMGASMIGYMAAPAINRKLGREEGDQRLQQGLMGAYLGQMGGSMLTQGGAMLPGMLKEGGRRATGSGMTAGLGRGAMGGRMGMTGGIRAAAGSAMTTGASRLAFLANPYAGLALTAASIGAGYYYGSESGEEDPWEKSVRERRGVAGKKIEKAQGFFGAAEAFSSGATGLVSNYETLTGPQRSEQFKGVSKAFSNMLPELPEDRVDEVRGAYVDLKKSLLSGEGMFEAEQKLSKTLHKVAQAMDELRESSEGAGDALGIEEAAAEFSGLPGSQSQRKAGAMVGRVALPHQEPVYSDRLGPRVIRMITGQSADVHGQTPIGHSTVTNPETGLPYLETDFGAQPSGAEVLMPKGKEFAKKASDYLKPQTTAIIQSLAQQVAHDVPYGEFGPSRDGEQFESDRLFRDKWAMEKGMFGLSKEDSPGGVNYEEARKEFRVQRKIRMLTAKGLSGLRELSYTDSIGDVIPAVPSKGALDELTKSGKDGKGYHSLIQQQVMDNVMAGVDPDLVNLFNTPQAPRPPLTDRTPMIQEFLGLQRGVRSREAGRKEAMGLFTKEQAMKETTRAGKASLSVRLAEAQGGEYAGLEAQRQADLAKAKADRDDAIAAAKERARLRKESLQDLFTEGIGKAGTSKQFLDSIPSNISNQKARDSITQQYDELKKLFDKPITTESLKSIDKVIADMSVKVSRGGGDAALTAQLKDLKQASKTAEEGMLDLSNTTTSSNAAFELLKPHIEGLADETLRVTKELKLFSAAAMNVVRAENVRVAKSKVEALENVKGATGAEKAAAATELRRAKIAAGEGFQGFGGLRDSFRYNTNDAALEFDAAMVDLGYSVKDSMKGAIKDIVSGADSFKDAMFNVFAALADKLADQGISMGVDSLFDAGANFFTRSRGGSIPRGYNKGGVVTGGSGVRDDVMTRMQGGEYVIKKSAAQKIGYGTLGAINSYAGGGQARVSLAKEFLYTGDDPKRPTGGKYNVSRNLSTAALFREDDPQTGEMFGRQATLTNYLEYRRKEQERRDKILDNIKQQKKQRLTNAYMSAAMRIGVAAMPARGANPATVKGPGGATQHRIVGDGGIAYGGPGVSGSGYEPAASLPTRSWPDLARGGSPAMVMGGEYIMSPRTVSKYGTGFMSQLNQGRLPSFQSGGLVGGGAAMAAGITTNNVSLSVNIDKSGGATAETGKGSRDRTKNDERGDAEEAQSSKEFAEAIRGAVLKEITKQQRPGGLLRDGATWAAGRRT